MDSQVEGNRTQGIRVHYSPAGTSFPSGPPQRRLYHLLPCEQLQSVKTIVILPTYNEIENLARIVQLIREQPGGFRILIVDDNSPDGTGRLADELAAQYPGEIDVLHRKCKEGLGRAYVAGFDYVLQMGG